jgi:hypothetical protein
MMHRPIKIIANAIDPDIFGYAKNGNVGKDRADNSLGRPPILMAGRCGSLINIPAWPCKHQKRKDI